MSPLNTQAISQHHSQGCLFPINFPLYLNCPWSPCAVDCRGSKCRFFANLQREHIVLAAAFTSYQMIWNILGVTFQNAFLDLYLMLPRLFKLSMYSSSVQAAAYPSTRTIGGSSRVISLHARWPIKTPRPTCAKGEFWTHSRASRTPACNVVAKFVLFVINFPISLIRLWLSCHFHLGDRCKAGDSS